MKPTPEMIAAACEAFSKAHVIYPSVGCKIQITDWFELEAEDAVAFGVLKSPKWSLHSDIRSDEYSDFVAAVIKEPMREAITAALSAMPAVRVKGLEWSEGPFVFAAETTIGTYYIEDQGRNWAGDRYWLTSSLIKIALKFPTLEAAKAAAQADYEARIPAIEPAGVAVETPSPQTHLVAWQPIATADKNQERLTLGVSRGDKLEEIHIGGYRHALNDDEESCWWSDQCDDEIAPTHWMPDLSAPSVTPAQNAVGPFSDVVGFGASYQRECDQWIVYTMPGAKRIGSIDGYNKVRLDWVVEALRAAHAQGSVFSSWVPPTGTKRAIVEELRKARSDFMINDFEIAERMVEAIRRLAAEEVEDNTPAPQPRTSVQATLKGGEQ